MQDVLSLLASLRRPGLLIRAARHGQDDYNRKAHLPRHLGYGVLPRHGAALLRLMELEADQNAKRAAGDAGYALSTHVDLLIAMMGEARLLRQAQAEARAGGDSLAAPGA
ncbi:DUF6477 family protein [Mesobacterium pallidum]|uniref:DUF6477 family protein n=1 Tax=Mesobacterium pallidum TaxID=2872037 RepID=UPI001EE26A7E|nr:DUF6477 family protein [Mesobacterium pallidum]